jgi:hypothetical protein
MNKPLNPFLEEPPEDSISRIRIVPFMFAVLVMLAVIVGVFSCAMTPARAEEYTNDQIANAIFKAENSKSHPYGIMQHYKHTTPRQACINTIRHARRDWNGEGDFIAYLQKRYAPLGVKNDPRGLNKNWLKNVRYYLAREI